MKTKNRVLSTTTRVITVGAALFLAGRVFAQTIPFPTYDECEAQGGRLTFCHATSSEENPYVRLTTACEALYGRNGNAGHLDENGTPQAGHEDDVMLDASGYCPGENDVEPTPTPTPGVDPSPTPEPTEPPSDKQSKLSSLGYDCNCDSDPFKVTMDLTKDGQPAKDVKVEFTYNFHTQVAMTNDNGRAEVFYDKDGDGSIVAKPDDGYAQQSLSFAIPTDCDDPDSGVGGPVSTGSNTSSQSIGTGSLADTGSQLDGLTLTIAALGFITSLTGAYAKIKK